MLLSGLPLLSQAYAPHEQEEAHVRIMTYNIHHGEAVDGTLSLSRIAELIQAHDVDLVALQEVDRNWSERSAFADQAQDLADRLGMYYFFGPIYDLEPDDPAQPRRQYGLAILSAYPLIREQNYELTRLPSVGDQTRTKCLPGFPMVTVDVNGTPLHVYDTHLDYRADPGVRTVQVLEMMQWIEQTIGPKVLLGDFNALPDADELRPIRAVFADAWTLRGTGPGYTYPADAPVKRIDAIFVTPDIRVDSVAVLESTASDHRPVLADLVLGH